MIAKLLVANRGEIASRVLRAARAMGMATVAVCSDADRDAPFVAEADEVVALGGAPAEAYLRVEAVLDAAERTGADAVHPGYGFLAESPELAAGCRKRGLVFVGPTPEVLAALGDKVEARRVAAAAGVPVLPGEAVTGLDGGELAAAAARVGFPLLVKAAAGGGGIGMRVVGDPAELAEAVAATRRQAAAAFGDDAVLLERWLDGPRHVEVQVVGDGHGRIAQLFERECSIQRRHQKLVEEAPSPAVGPDLRHRLGEAALAVARAVGYTGAGTVEFLLEDAERFWFLEVNARIQVEHPVTEAVTGLDLVRLQLLVAAGQPLPPAATRARLDGHAIEARLYAEDPAAGFLPQAGVLRRFRVGDRGARVDAGVADWSVVGVHYDPLLAKVIVHAPTREEAAGRLAAVLAAARLHGVVTNRDLLIGVLRSEAFLAGETDTSFLDRHPPAELAAAGGSRDPATTRLHAAAAALAAQAERRAAASVCATIPSGWRNNPSQLQRADLRPVRGEVVPVGYRFDRAGALASLEVSGNPLVAPRLWRCAPDPEAARTWLLDLEVDGVRRRFEVHLAGDLADVDSPLGHTELHEAPRFPEVAPAGVAGSGDGVVVSPLPGVVRRVAARAGERVEAGAVVVVVEAMKTEHRIAAGRAGTVGRVLVAEGQEVAAGAVVVELEGAPDG
ncbi:MAG TPA: biotin carboxylase N-terminal domain-containing protein [Actinomycetota bacterium]|nr:biotin carboxylase N-terminal domain-containing protein [Actinomycetota bacterium]